MSKETDRFAVGGLGIEVGQNGIAPIAVVGSNDEGLASQMIDHIDGHIEELSREISDNSNTSSKSYGMSGSWKGSAWVPEGPKPNWVEPGKKLN